MRVTTQLAYERAIDAMNDRQARLVRSQEELATGKRLLSPSDDPTAAADAERTRSQLRRIEIQQRMNDFATNMLGQAESTLSRTTDLMQSLREGFVQAGNGSLSPTDRGLLAQQFRSYREELYTLANRPDGAGGFVFGGQGTRTEPFSVNGSVTYDATPGVQQVGLDHDTPTSVDGRTAFMTVPTASGQRSVFDIVDDALAVLEDPNAAKPAVTAAVQSALGGIDTALDRVQQRRTDIGEHLKALEGRAALNETSSIELSSELSDLVDLDFAKAISEFSANQTALQAAMKTYSEISKMTLFDYV
jgi:flagellar hook-associated protein 3 FlgL